jgi:hypothetical protein
VTKNELTRYAEAVERRLGQQRGREHVLSPRDFDLVRTWYRGGIPLARALDAIDRAAQTGDALTSLAPLRQTLTVRSRL